MENPLVPPADGSVLVTELWVSGYDNPQNDGNVLRYGERNAGEFALYDEFEPRRKIELILDGTSDETGIPAEL